MRCRIFRAIAGVVSILILAGAPIHADPVVMSDVIQIIGSYQNSLELRSRSLPQTETSVPGVSTSLLAGVDAGSDQSQSAVQTIPQGDVDVTICDCGEILVAGGFPKWPLLFLTAIPFFLPHDEDNPDVPPVTPPTLPPPGILTPPQTPIPEPASLLLFGSGLVAFGAVLRRRYTGMKLAARADATQEANRDET